MHFSQESCAWKVTRRTKLSRKNFSNSGSSFLSLSLFFLLHPSQTSVLFFHFRTTQMLLLCSKVTSTNTTNTTFYLSFQASHWQTPPSKPPHIHAFMQHPLGSLCACVLPCQADWQLITVTDFGRLYCWQSLTETARDTGRRAERACLLETDANTEETKKNRTRWRREAWRRSRVEAGRGTEAEIKRETERIECAL